MSEQRSPLMSAVRPNSDAEHKLESLRPYNTVTKFVGRWEKCRIPEK